MIIPVFRVIASTLDMTAGVNCRGGEVLKMDSSTGKLVLCTATSTDVPVGIAGDRTVAADSFEWTNRASDYGNATAASGTMTVYHGGGEFWLDVDDSTINTPYSNTAITGVIANAATVNPGTLLYTAANGQMTNNTASTKIVGVALTGKTTIETGIPGEFEPGSSVNYANDAVPRTWVRVKLTI